MNNILHSKTDFHKELPASEIHDKSQVDSQALQELIDILKEPFQTTCDACHGVGFLRNGGECPACHGKGKVLEKLFK